MYQHGRRVAGIITSVSCRETRRKGLWSHSYKVGGFEYSILADDTVPQFRAGDTVRFEWTTRKGRWRTYRNIVGRPTLLRPHEDSERADGYVYVLTNRSMKGLVKIGMTTRSPEARCAEVSQATGVPIPYEVAWSHVVVGNVALVERLVHESLSSARFNKEFFRITPEEAQEAILEVYFSLYPEQRDTPNNHEARRLAYEAEREKARLARGAELEFHRQQQLKSGEDVGVQDPSRQPLSLDEMFEQARARHAAARKAASSPQPPEQGKNANETILYWVLMLAIGVGLFVLVLASNR